MQYVRNPVCSMYPHISLGINQSMHICVLERIPNVWLLSRARTGAVSRT